MKLGVAIMVKNEEKHIQNTLNTLKEFDEIIIFDTGSTDGTVETVKQFPNVKVFEGNFVDFSTSRNQLFDFTDSQSDCEYFLLFDSGDEFKGDINALKKEIEKTKCTCYLVPQVWDSGVLTRYFN